MKAKVGKYFPSFFETARAHGPQGAVLSLRPMGKGKLRKFAENRTFGHVVEPTKAELAQGAFPHKGRWNAFFGNDQPLVLELGCGRGEYTVALAARNPDRNHIGIDIKGARIWQGAKLVADAGLKNAAFLRTQLVWIEEAFGPGEVDEIWITFPDPQIKFRRAKHRLVSPAFLERYARLLKPGGRIHLKTDSEFLHGYLQGLLEVMGWPVYEAYHDIHNQIQAQDGILFQVQTYYEQLFRGKGKTITYLAFSPPTATH
jgi:tRNA (guanine-N7-)-methyltransferase